MRTLAERLASAMNASRHSIDASDARLVPVVSKLQCLSDKPDYARLLSDLFRCNDKSNLDSLLFEATFAWHFEMKGKRLVYEVLQQHSDRTTIDFLYTPSQDMHVYYELRLLQQQAAITAIVEDQLRKSNCSRIALDGSDEQHEVVRLQQVLLDKVQDQQGNPIKFFSTEHPNYNMLVVDVSELFLGTMDRYDCILSCCGDRAVPPLYRRGIFGVFQTPRCGDPAPFWDRSQKFNHLREMIHGILFMRKPPTSNPIDFQLQYCFVRNKHILSENAHKCILAELEEVFALWSR